MTIYTYDAVVVGTGAAGYNAACRIAQLGKKSVAIVTEAIDCGTSRNTGSDKQTYYKLGLDGSQTDSIRKMAETLFEGGCVDGDHALCEAALSARCFMKLCELDVPFPVNRYGEYVGYKTDHDPYARATSAGPLTSRFMTEALQKQATELGIEIYDGILAVEVLKHNDQVCGLLGLEIASGELIAFRSGDLVLATGGPAGIYADSVYPKGHTGTTSLALMAGAKAQNLTEWQYGLASTAPRWNVSGTYMQVLPRFVSIDENGGEHEFLLDYFKDPYQALSAVFLKGYQWPFDSRKVLEGSSVIDLLVFRESVIRKRKVYLDFTKNPFGLQEIEYGRLKEECRGYLQKADACFGNPIKRLLKMNAPAVELYRSKGVNIEEEYLEIALCAQHHNGGISVDLWWQTSIKGLFAVGECAGTHGVTRPGGSALNAGQVGSLRAAQYISAHGNELTEAPVFESIVSDAVKRHKNGQKETQRSASLDPKVMILRAQRRMSDYAAALRKKEDLKKVKEACQAELKMLKEQGIGQDPLKVYQFYKLKDILITQTAVLTAMIDYADTVGATRGSALYYDAKGILRNGLEEEFRFLKEDGSSRSQIQQVSLKDGEFVTDWRRVRPIPEEDDFFENVWRDYRVHKNVY